MEDLRVDVMTINSLDDPRGFAQVAESWRSAFVEMAMEHGWQGDRLRALNRGLFAYRRAALEGYASWPIWVASARRPE